MRRRTWENPQRPLDTTDIRLPGTVGTTMRVRNLDTKGNTLAAAFTFSHGTCTSCSEVRNQNNQLDYCSRLPGKMQAFFQKILRFFGKPNSFSHRCTMPAVPLLALCATSPGRGVCLSEGASGEEEKLSGMPKPPSLREGDRVSGGRSNTPLSKTSKNSIIYGILKKGRNIE